MGKMERISGAVDAGVYAEVTAAVARGDLVSPDALVKELVTEWAASQRPDTPENVARIRSLIEESRADPRPSVAAEDLFAELEARYADPA
jgi:hypothetical protein